MRIIIILAVVLFSFAARAQGYVSGYAGLTILPDIDATSAFGTSTIESDPGFGIGVAGGYKFNFGLRAEAEVSLRGNNADNVDGVSADGPIAALAVMGNLWYDINTNTSLIPYIGGGVGFARLGADIDLLSVKLVDDADTVFAYQFGGGLGYNLGTGFILFGEYRYFATADPTFTAEPIWGIGPFDAEYSTHNILVGLRKEF